MSTSLHSNLNSERKGRRRSFGWKGKVTIVTTFGFGVIALSLWTPVAFHYQQRYQQFLFSGEGEEDNAVYDAHLDQSWWRGVDTNQTRLEDETTQGARVYEYEYEHEHDDDTNGNGNGTTTIIGMIVNPSTERIKEIDMYSTSADNGTNNNIHSTEDSELKLLVCPHDSNAHSVEGEGGMKVLQRTKLGLHKSMQYLNNYIDDSIDGSTQKEDAASTKQHPKRRSRILCLVYTYQTSHNDHKNLRALAQTWGRRCDGFIAASNYTDHSIGAIDLIHKGTEEYGNIYQKVRSIWAYAYNHYLNEYDFFYVCGDDTYVVVENMRAYFDGPEVERLERGYLDDISNSSYVLDNHNVIRDWGNRTATSTTTRTSNNNLDQKIVSDRPLIFGSPLLWYNCPCFTGGSGYALNRAALELFGRIGLSSHFPDNIDSREDIFMGGFFCNQGIILSDTRSDNNGGLRFGIGDAENAFHYEGVSPLHPEIIAERLNFSIPLGINSLAEDVISFHLKDSSADVPEVMYRYEAILYDRCKD